MSAPLAFIWGTQFLQKIIYWQWFKPEGNLKKKKPYNCSEGMSRLPKDSSNHLGEKYSEWKKQNKNIFNNRFSKLHLFPNQNKDGNLLEL